MRALVALLAFLFCLPAFAQETPEEERSLFLSFIENQLSTPNRQIRITGIQGVLSSNARIGQITVADREGVWLTIRDAAIDWSRSALVLRQRLEISSLTAAEIEVTRQPLPEEGLPAPEAGGFALPELPLAINIGALEVARASFGPTVFGLESVLSLTGRISLDEGALDTALEVSRLDGPGGTLQLAATYSNATETVDLDLRLSEPENGVVANLLNIEGRPPLDLVLAGEGPLGELDVALTIDAGDTRVMTGVTALRRSTAGLGFAAELRGPIAQLVPAQFRSFFGAETALETRGLLREGGGLTLEELTIDGASVQLQASAETSADGFLRRLAVNAVIDDGSPEPVVLPVPGGDTTLQVARLDVSYGENGEQWSALLEVEDFASPTFAADATRFDLSGLLQNPDVPTARRLTYALTGAATGIAASTDEITEALGDRIDLTANGGWSAGEPLRIDAASIAARALDVTLAGNVIEYAFRGQIAVETSSIAPFSALAGRDLEGSLQLRADGEVRPLTGAFDLTLDGQSVELRIDNEAVDNLMSGQTTLSGRVGRGEDGLTTDDFRVANEQFTVTADGNFATGAADFEYAIVLSDLALVTPQASGELTLEGSARGADGTIALLTTLRAPSGELAGKQLREAALAFEGSLASGTLTGFLAGSAFLDGVRSEIASDIVLVEGSRRLDNLAFTAGGAELSGSIVQNANGLFDGALSLEAADISTAAALLLTDATGAIEAQVKLTARDGQQDGNVTANVSGLRTEGVVIGRAEVAATIEDLFGVPVVDGNVSASAVEAGGVTVETLTATAASQGGTTRFDANASINGGVEVAAAGSLQPEAGGYRVALDQASLGRGPITAQLSGPASVLVVGDDLAIDGLAIDVAGGRIAANGRIADEIDLALDINALPLEIANLIRPDLGLGGQVNGAARVTGTRDAPQVAFEITGRQVAAAALRSAGLTTLSIDARGRSTASRLDVDATVTSPQGLNARVAGAVPLDDGQIALDVTLAAFPLAILNTVAPGQDLSGAITGSARITGTTASPQASFNLNGAALGAAPLREFGIAGLDLAASGSFADDTVTLTNATASGPLGLSLTASGRVPLEGAGLAVNLGGSIPLALANRLLLERGTQLSGTVQVQGSVTGSLDQPNANVSLSTAGAQVLDPDTNIALQGISLQAAVAGQTVTISQFSGTLAGGGTVSANGTVSIDGNAGFPANLSIAFNQARYADGDLLVATVTGNLSVTGALTRDPLIAGRINVDRAEITVPESFGGGAAQIDVVHRSPPPQVRATLARASDGTPVPSSRPSVARLDIQVTAPNRIFVRGRGLDAELGGEVRLIGPISDIQPVGGFQLIRGRLGILGQRITFDEGTVTLVGDLDPFLNFVARSSGNDITVFITVSGRVSDLDISFSSQPELPEDEVLARLIFNRGIGELSPLQIAQLAAAAAELAGGSNTSLLGSLRNATGLDDLDVVTDSEGNVAVRAGRYIQENVYLGVEAGAQGSARATINLDITDELRARGGVGTDGDTSLGVFYERDY
jgi:translocation and assembly module TamB